jgi:hypothetical protein
MTSSEPADRKSDGFGEVLVGPGTAAMAGLDPQLERLRLELMGKQEPTEVVRLAVGSNVRV